MAFNITSPFTVFFDVDGKALEDGFIYIGTAGLNPLIEANRIQVYSDNALTIPIAQPIRTLGGYPVASGTPINLWVAPNNYSLVVQDKHGRLVYSSLTNDKTLDSTIINYAPSSVELAAGSIVVNTFWPWGRDKRYGTIGDGTTDDTTPVANWFLMSRYYPAVGTPGAIYKTTATTFIPYHGCIIDLNGGTLDFYGNPANSAVDFTLVANVYPQSGRFYGNITVRTGARGINIRSSFWDYNLNIVTKLAAAGASGAELPGDETFGTGPYYNTGKISVNCQDVASQFGIKCIAVAPAFRGPNDNNMEFPNVAVAFIGLQVCGAGNHFRLGAQACGTSLKGKLFGVNQTTQNIVEVTYQENCGVGIVWDAGCKSNDTIIGFYTGIGGALYTDNDGTNTYRSADLGIRFGNLAVANNPRALNWFENWTDFPVLPTIAGAGTPGAQTYTTRVARYFRMGNLVTFYIYILMSAKDAATAGILRIGNLPYAASNGANRNVVLSAAGRFDLDAGFTMFNAVTVPAQSYMFIIESGDNVNAQALAAANLVAATELYISGSYEV